MLNVSDRIKLEVVDESPYEYFVKYEGQRYPVKKFLFQRRHGLSRPVRLDCYVYNISGPDKRIDFRQDLAPIFRERYQDKQIYEFTVDADMTGSDRPHYRVTDGSGYWIPLPVPDGERFNKGDRLKLRVNFSRNKQKMFVTLARNFMAASAEPPTLRILIGELGRPFLRLLKQLRDGGLLQQCEGVDTTHWDIDAVREARKAVFSLEDEVLGRRHLADDVRAFRNSVTYLLEDSGFMLHISEPARSTMQEELALTASRADDMLTAVELIDSGRHERFVRDTLDKIRTSGYLYRPESRLRVLIYIFSLESRLFDKKMRELIETIQQGDPDNWRSEPFRSAFIEQLQLYIDSKHEQFDTESDPESNHESSRRLNLLITALAIQQLLLEGATPPPEFIINRSRLYRYHAFKKHCDRQRMLEKALQVILSQRVDETEFSWKDTLDQLRLSQCLLRAPEPAEGVQSYETCNCTLRIADGRITFSGAGATPGYATLGDKPLWHNLQVYLPTPLDPRLRSPRTIGDFKEIWSQIERRIFKKQQPRTIPAPAKPIVRLPSPGDEVKIIIDGIIDDANYACHVEEFGFRGSGRINIRDISGSKRMLEMSAFDDADGQPMLFMAAVTGVDGDELTFSMADGVHDFIMANVSEGDCINAVVTSTPNPKNHFTYTVLTANGYLVSIGPDDTFGKLSNGQQVEVEITHKSESDYFLKGRVTGPSEGFVQYQDALSNLLFNYAIPDDSEAEATEAGEAATDNTDAGQTDDLLTDEEAQELMFIIARRADMDAELTHSYNYFAAARLLARMIAGEPDIETRPEGVYNYFDRRCRMLEVLDDFANNGRVDLDRLKDFNTSLTGASDPHTVKLRILAAMEHPDLTGQIWEMMQREQDDQVTQLGRLVIAYNAIDGFKLGEEQRKIRESIYRLLNLDVDSQPVQIAGGRESQTVEFKTSAAYPAGGVMRLDKEAQLTELVQVVCGFLNSTGGKLYIGVSDEGYVRGLANDIEAYGDIEKIVLALNNAIESQIGFIPNYASHIRTEYADYGEKTIIVVDITPLPAPVRCNGVYYERQGTSTRYVPDNKEQQFLKSHRAKAAGLEPKTESRALPEAKAAAAEAVVTAAVPAPAPEAETPASAVSEIATSRLRPNFIHYDGSEAYHAPALYFFIGADGSYQISADELWTDEDAALALGLSEEEAAGHVIVVYKSGHMGRIPVSALTRSRRHMLNTRQPAVFIAPAEAESGVLVHYRDEKGIYIKQFYTADMIPEIKPADQGDRLVAGEPVHCELVGPESLSQFSMLQRNGQRVGRKQADVDASVAEVYSRIK